MHALSIKFLSIVKATFWIFVSIDEIRDAPTNSRSHPRCRKQEILSGEAEQKHRERTEPPLSIRNSRSVERDEAASGDQPPRRGRRDQLPSPCEEGCKWGSISSCAYIPICHVSFRRNYLDSSSQCVHLGMIRSSNVRPSRFYRHRAQPLITDV